MEGEGGRMKDSFFGPPDLDFESPVWSPRERAQMMHWYEATHGPGDSRLVPFAPFMIDNNPAGFKRYRQHSLNFAKAGTKRFTYAPAIIYTYAVIGYAAGCLYEIIATRQRGLTKRQVQELLAFAYISSGPFGMNETAEVTSLYLAAWEDDGQPSTHEWPDGWKVDPSAFRSGIDVSTPGFTPKEIEALESWHRRTGGEVPGHVRLWAELNPASLKTQRARYEASIGQTLPAQLFPLCTLMLATYRVLPTAVRRSLLQAKALGVRRQDAVQAMEIAFIYGGEWQMEAVLTDEVAAIFRAWRD